MGTIKNWYLDRDWRFKILSALSFIDDKTMLKIQYRNKAGQSAILMEMIDVAETLSADFPAVRVDLYSIDGKIYFGELTFYPWAGYVKFVPDEFDFELGQKFILPEKILL